MKIIEQEPLSKHTTFRIGGPARYFCSPRNISELKKALQFAKEGKLNVFIIGAGSNLLAADRGYRGLVIRPKLANIELKKTGVTAEAGVPIQHLLATLAENGLTGLEFITGIPGAVGGSVAMNAGMGNEEIGEKVVRVWALNKEGKEKIILKKRCGFGYRKSIFQKQKLIISKVEFKLKKGKTPEIRSRIRERWERRLASQPYDLPSAGSVFRNPGRDFAGRLIEAAGLKGKKIGGAQISRKHANFIVNLGRAKARDVLSLMRTAKKTVRKKFAVGLRPEIVELR